jgi:drug/metabolite transporter (DMT)-like permease
MYFVVGHLPSGLVALMVNTVPIFIYPMAVRSEGFSLARLIAVLLGVTGLLCILLPRAALPNPSDFHYGLYLLITPFCFALCAVFISNYWPRDAHPLTLSTGMLLVSALALTPLALKIGGIEPLWAPMTLAKGAVVLEIILSSIGYVLFFRLLKIAGPIYYSLVGGVVVLTGLFWGWVSGEVLNPWSWLAVFFILSAIVMMSFIPARR